MYSQLRSLDPVKDARVREQLRNKLISKIEEGRRVMGLDLIVRTPEGEIASEKGGVVALLRLHQEASGDAKDLRSRSGPASAQSASPPILGAMGTSQALLASTAAASLNSTLGRRRQPAVLTSALTSRTDVLRAVRRGREEPRHLLLDVKAFMCSVGEASQLAFSVWNRTSAKQLSEEWYVRMTGQGMPEDVDRIGQLRVIFRDLPARDFETPNQEIYLVCRIIRRGKLKVQVKQEKKAIDYRRPFAAAVLPLSSLSAREKEQIIPIAAGTSEDVFVQLPEMIVRGSGTVPVARAMGISIGARMLGGPLTALLQEEVHLCCVLVILICAW